MASVPEPEYRHGSNSSHVQPGEEDKRSIMSSHSDIPATSADAKHDKEATEERRGRSDGRREITEDDCWDELGFAFPTWKKWMILSVIFMVQMSMNFNSSVIANAIQPISDKYHVSEQKARVAQMIFLILYAFGCELWAPWSEEFGRWIVLQLSLFLVNIWQIPAALPPNLATIFVARGLGGISSAGGSVTLGMVADMWTPDDQQYAVAFVVLSSVAGSTIGAVFGGVIQDNLSLPWFFWIQLILGGVVQIMHFFLVPETRSTVMMDRIAKRRRLAAQKGEGNPDDINLYGPNELKESRLDFKEVLTIWSRPFIMFLREPIVLFLSLLSGFSDALIFTFFEGFQPVYKQYGFSATSIGWVFWAVEIGYVIAYFSFFPFIMRDNAIRRRDPDALQPERRLRWLLYTAPLEPIGLFIFAWTSTGPPIPWIVPTIFAGMIGVANYCIYMASIDYMIASYGPYSASATGGNGFARDFLAGVAAMYSTPLFTNIEPRPLPYASTILGCLACLVTIPIYIFYWKGPIIREKSKFAQVLASDLKAAGRRSSVNLARRAESRAASRAASRSHSRASSRHRPEEVDRL